jgi:hypothetical protein
MHLNLSLSSSVQWKLKLYLIKGYPLVGLQLMLTRLHLALMEKRLTVQVSEGFCFPEFSNQ